MPFYFETQNIEQPRYIRLIDRQLTLNMGDKQAEDFKATWEIHVIPVEKAEEYKQFFEHLDIETSAGIAWGITMPPATGHTPKLYLFVVDIKNFRILMSNFDKISHEIGHALAYIKWKNKKCTRRYDNPEAPRGTEGPCYVTRVHDMYYGSKKRRTYWVRFGIIWVPVKLLDVYSLLRSGDDE